MRCQHLKNKTKKKNFRCISIQANSWLTSYIVPLPGRKLSHKTFFFHTLLVQQIFLFLCKWWQYKTTFYFLLFLHLIWHNAMLYKKFQTFGEWRVLTVTIMGCHSGVLQLKFCLRRNFSNPIFFHIWRQKQLDKAI